MAYSIAEFLTRLDRFHNRIALDSLAGLLGNLEIRPEDVREFVQFGHTTYRRNLMHSGPHYQALILCWRNGQRSPIHDHRGSSCGVRVIRGVATETTYERSPNGMVVALRSREIREGSVCATQDTDIHQMSNLGEGGADLITLHIYSPPLLRMGTYSVDDTAVGEFDDPVVEHRHGAGVRPG